MKYDFDCIAGYETQKRELKRLCEIFGDRETHEKRGAKLPKGVIFFGSAGTGKTLFAKVMANECGLKVLKIDAGDAEEELSLCRNIRKVFARAARRREPTMIFFDELDKFLPDIEEEYVTDRSKTVLAQLLTLIDGMDSSGNAVFVATCNDFSSLPEPLIRPGRIDKKIGLALPDLPSREAILDLYTGRSSCRFGMETRELAKLTNGFTCAALETLVNECILRSDENGDIGGEVISEVMHEIKAEDLPRPRASADDVVDAYRALGSFVVARSMNDGGYVLDLGRDTVCNDFFNGVLSDIDSDYNGEDDYEEDEDDDDFVGSIGFSSRKVEEEEEEDDEGEDFGTKINCERYSVTDYLNAVAVRLGGAAAEEVLLRKFYNNLKWDMINTERLILNLCSCGMFGLRYYYDEDRHDDFPYSQERVDRINALVEEKTEACYQRAKEIVERNGDLIRKLVPVLVSKREIEKEEFEPILAKFGGLVL